MKNPPRTPVVIYKRKRVQRPPVQDEPGDLSPSAQPNDVGG